MRSATALLVGAACLVSSPSNAAPTPQDKALAQSLFREGRALLTSGNTAQACAKLMESDKLDPQIGTHLNVALCHETLGRTASAWVEFGEVVDLAERLHDDDRGKFARQHAQDLDKKLSRVRLRMMNAPDDLRVEIDGAVIGRAAFDTSIPLDPGPHELRASARGRKTATRAFEVPAGPSSLEVTVPRLDRATLTSSAPVTSTPETSSTAPSNDLRTAGFVLGGVGLAGIVVGSIFGGLAFAQNATADANCPFLGGTACNPDGVSAGNDASTSALVSTVAFIAGATCLAAGVVLVVVGKPSSTTRVGFVPGGLFLRGSF